MNHCHVLPPTENFQHPKSTVGLLPRHRLILPILLVYYVLYTNMLCISVACSFSLFCDMPLDEYTKNNLPNLLLMAK